MVEPEHITFTFEARDTKNTKVPTHYFLIKIETEKSSRATQDAMSFDPRVQFDAVRKLAISGYTREAADVLAMVVADTKVSETTRDYAAMGLGNFTSKIPSGQKDSVRKVLREVLHSEAADTPDGILRTLLAWGDADLIQEELGPGLKTHTMQVEVLERSSDPRASDLLWEIYQACPEGRKAEHYNRRAQVGRALVGRKDIRGIDILVGLLPADKAPGPQYRSNVFIFLAIRLGQDFGYGQGNYRPELEQAVPKMISWWEHNRKSFAFGPPNRQ